MRKPASLSGLPFRADAPDRDSEIQNITWRFADDGTPFVSARVARLYDWWRAAGGGRVPPRSAFDVTRHAGLIAHLFLVRVLPEGRFRFQLQGEAVTGLLGTSDAGRTIGVEDARAYDRDLARYYALVAGDGRCRVCTGTLAPFDQPLVSVEAIDCPLADDAGAVCAILGAIDRINPA